MTTAYNGRCRLQFDIEHKCDLVEFGIKNLTVGASTEEKIIYPSSSIEQIASTVYPEDGECYVCTTPPLNPAGIWSFSVAYRLTGTDNIIVSAIEPSTRVDAPDNSLLKDDADGVTP